MVSEKITWKWIRIPVEVYETISRFAEREKIARWKVIQRAVSYWHTTQVEHHKKHIELDKAAWYAFKLSASVGELRAKPDEKNLALLEKTCNQIKDRLGVDTGKIVLAATQYVKRPTRKNRMVLNDATKEVIAQIISLA